MADGKVGPRMSERTPLLSGVSHVETVAPPGGGGGGRTLREAGGGLVNDAYDEEPDAVCWGYEQEAYAALARLPAIHTYTMIAFFCYFGHVWLLMQRPDLAVTVIIAMIAYAFARFWIMWLSAYHGLFLLYRNDSRDPMYWQRQARPLGSPEFSSVWHAVIIPNYKEPVGKLRQTLDTIAANSVAKNIVVCMAMEARDANAVAVADALQAEYGGRLGGFCYSLHPITAGEVAGKSSNENWAARCVSKHVYMSMCAYTHTHACVCTHKLSLSRMVACMYVFCVHVCMHICLSVCMYVCMYVCIYVYRCVSKHLVDTLRVPETSIVLTTCDADTFFHNNHFAYLTHAFLCDGDERFHKFYFPVTNFMPNVHEVLLCDDLVSFAVVLCVCVMVLCLL